MKHLVPKKDILQDCGNKYMIKTERGYTHIVNKEDVVIFTSEAQKVCVDVVANWMKKCPTINDFFNTILDVND